MKWFLFVMFVVLLGGAHVFYLFFVRVPNADPDDVHDFAPLNVYDTMPNAIFSQFTLMLGDFDLELLQSSPYPNAVRFFFVAIMPVQNFRR